MADQRERWSIVDALSHSRHDWMNKLQLIKGHLSLKKYDRVKEFIDEIVVEAKQESKLCNLNMPSFAELLLTYNWKGHLLILDYEVLGEAMDCSGLDEEMFHFTTDLFQILNQNIDKKQENHITITLELFKTENNVRFFYDFNGILTDDKTLLTFLEQYQSDAITIQQIHFDTYEFTLMVSKS
ncbi:Spo0B C-terminal domain-containing protein [Aeribacillus sp. FSL M8-0235]|uniref:Spo0B C-terminal domain-containing protein n=1 Tax=Aeribacillus sp. FSL M8-0235 TaxID=2954576 RepID=UPI0030FADFA5